MDRAVSRWGRRSERRRRRHRVRGFGRQDHRHRPGRLDPLAVHTAGWRARRHRGAERRAGREHLRRHGLRWDRRLRTLSPGHAPLEQSGQSDVQRIRAAGRRRRLQPRSAPCRLRRGGCRIQHDVRAHARRAAAVGTNARRFGRHVHATAAPARDRAGRQPLHDGHGRGERLEPSPHRPSLGKRDLEPLAVSVKRHVSTERRARRHRLFLAQPQLPRGRTPGRRHELDLLRR